MSQVVAAAQAFRLLADPIQPEWLGEAMRKVVEWFESLGVDARDGAQAIYQILLPERVENFPTRAARERDQEIARCYQELDLLAESGDETRYQQTLARLRTLQEAAAAEMNRYFDAHRPFDPDRFEQVLSIANELLARHEDPSR